MKHEWRKHEKELYGVTTTPKLVEVPKQKYLTIKGKGNPNEKDFSERIGVLYSLSYGIRMLPKSGHTPDGYYEYTVYPLEGTWFASDSSTILNKDCLQYTLMIRQPDFVSEEIVNTALELVQKKKPHKLLDEISLEEITDGLSVQLLHVGSYDDEPLSFQKMDMFLEDHGLLRTQNVHREIYLTNNKKTILRYAVT